MSSTSLPAVLVGLLLRSGARVAWLSRIAVAALAAAALIVVPSVGGQPATARRVTVTDRDACSDCIHLERVAVLGDSSIGPSAIFTGAWAMNSSGTIFLHGQTVSQLSLFDITGRALASIGRRGQGPGEFAQIARMKAGRGDSVWVYDSGMGRMTVLAGPRGEYARSFPLTVRPLDWINLPDGNLLIATEPLGAGAARYSIHLLGAEGSHIRSLGPPLVMNSNEPPTRQQRLIGAASDPTRFWTATPQTYEIELWTISGTEEMVIFRSLPWFGAAGANETSRSPTPTARLYSIHQDSAGLLWIWIMKPRQEFRPRAARGEVRISELGSVAAADSPYEFHLDVIDPRRQIVVATMTRSAPLWFLDGDLALSPGGQGGLPSVTVFKVRLTRE